MAKWTVILWDWRPPTANELFRGKLRRRMSLEKDAKAFLSVYCRLFEVPPATGKRRVTIRVEMPTRRCDPDAFFKATFDALVACGALKGDSAVWLEIGTPEIVHGERLKTVITLEDLPMK